MTLLDGNSHASGTVLPHHGKPGPSHHTPSTIGPYAAAIAFVVVVLAIVVVVWGASTHWKFTIGHAHTSKADTDTASNKTTTETKTDTNAKQEEQVQEDTPVSASVHDLIVAGEGQVALGNKELEKEEEEEDPECPELSPNMCFVQGPSQCDVAVRSFGGQPEFRYDVHFWTRRNASGGLAGDRILSLCADNPHRCGRAVMWSVALQQDLPRVVGTPDVEDMYQADRVRLREKAWLLGKVRADLRLAYLQLKSEAQALTAGEEADLQVLSNSVNAPHPYNLQFSALATEEGYRIAGGVAKMTIELPDDAGLSGLNHHVDLSEMAAILLAGFEVTSSTQPFNRTVDAGTKAAAEDVKSAALGAFNYVHGNENTPITWRTPEEAFRYNIDYLAVAVAWADKDGGIATAENATSTETTAFMVTAVAWVAWEDALINLAEDYPDEDTDTTIVADAVQACEEYAIREAVSKARRKVRSIMGDDVTHAADLEGSARCVLLMRRVAQDEDAATVFPTPLESVSTMLAANIPLRVEIEDVGRESGIFDVVNTWNSGAPGADIKSIATWDSTAAGDLFVS